MDSHWIIDPPLDDNFRGENGDEKKLPSKHCIMGQITIQGISFQKRLIIERGVHGLKESDGIRGLETCYKLHSLIKTNQRYFC